MNVNNTQTNMEAVERLLNKRQAVPAQMTRNLLIDLRVARALVTTLQKRIVELESQPVAQPEPQP